MSVVLKCGDISLRPPTSDSIHCHLGWLHNKDLMRFSEQRHRSHTSQSQVEYLSSFDQRSSFYWDIILEENIIGSVTAYKNVQNGIADIGIIVARPGHGYGSLAWGMAMDWLFIMGARKIEGGCMRANKAMIRIFENHSFFLEGMRQGHFLLDGKPEDLMLYGRFK